MRILQVVVKNTSTVDFSLPLLQRLAQNGAQVSVLYCTPDRRQILRRSVFYSEAVREAGGSELDYLDFPRTWARPLRGILRRLFSASGADRLHLRELWQAHRTVHPTRGIIAFLQTLRRDHGTLRPLLSVFRTAASRAEHQLVRACVDLPEVWKGLSPELILFDNRSDNQFVGLKEMISYVEKFDVPVVLLPHAPHYRNPVGEFCPFLKSDPFPPYCEHWSPMKGGRPEEADGADPDRIAHVGYPGLDSDWLAQLRAAPHLSPRLTKRLSPRSCLFIVRRYLPEGMSRPPGLDPYIIDYKDLAVALLGLVEGVGDSEVEVVVKPHPSNDYGMLARDMARSGLRQWRISYEPIYAELDSTDLVVSLFSTILLVPAMAGIPTTIVETELQRHVHREWPLLSDIYRGMAYYARDAPTLATHVREILASEGRPVSSSDIEHLRQFFPDGATDRAMDRVTSLTHRPGSDATANNAAASPRGPRSSF